MLGEKTGIISVIMEFMEIEEMNVRRKNLIKIVSWSQ